MKKRMLRVSPDLAFPPRAITETFGILATRGAGKSNTGAVMAEEMFKTGLPFVVIDPVRAWYGLRSSRDGKRPGLPIPIFGGRYGDVPLTRESGVLIADLIVQKRLSCVLDLSEFESEAAKKTFLLDFAKRLYQKNEAPLHLFLEEADDYIPQRPMRDEAYLLRAWENIVRRGRARGLGITLITQRSASLNKNVLTQVQTLIPMRTTGPQDIAAIREWVKYHQQGETLLESLPGLKDGEAWVWSPHFLGKMVRVRFRLRDTYDSGATPTVRAARAPATLADIDLRAIKAKMQETIAHAKADDPKLLRAEISRLQAEVNKKSVPTPAEKYRQYSVSKRDQRHLVVLIQRARSQADTAERASKHAAKAAERLATVADMFRNRVTVLETRIPGVHIAPLPTLVRTPQATRLPRQDTSVHVGDSALGAGERAVLTSIAQHGLEGIRREEVTILTGYKRSTRDAYLQRLLTKGLIERNSVGVVVTGHGTSVLGDDFTPLPTGDALLKHWLGLLPEGERRCCEVIVNVYPNAITRESLSEKTGYKRSTRDAYVQRLRTRRLIVAERNGQLRASERLFG